MTLCDKCADQEKLFKMAFCLSGLSMTQAETAEEMGCSERWVRSLVSKNRAFFDNWSKFATEYREASVREVKRVTAESFRDELESLRGYVVEAYKRGVTAEDVKVALSAGREITDRLEGKSTSRVEMNHGGTIEHRLHAVPATLVAVMESEARKLDALELPLIEGEVIDD